MPRIEIKPLTVNRAWRGRRFKSYEYKAYETELFLRLPPFEIPKNKDLKLTLKFGLSNVLSDIDNPVKPFLDILQKAYGFNDKRIFRMEVEKVKVEKGKEYIEYKIL